MKRIISVLTVFVIVFVTANTFMLTAFAQEWEDIRNVQDISPYVNGKAGGEFYTEYDNSTQGLTITYGGEGVLTDWEFPLLEEGQDYEILSKDVKNYKITIRLLEGGRGEIPYINALVVNNNTNNVTEADVYTQAVESDTAEQDTIKEEDTVDNSKEIDEESTKKMTTICKTAPVDENTMSGTKIVIICVAAGVAVCAVVLIVSKNKKSRT